MGELYSITCENKSCLYHKELRVGVGMIAFARIKKLERDILDGKIENATALKSIKAGARIHNCGIYLCPQCKEIVDNATYFLLENLTCSSANTSQYKITFPFGKPQCDSCGSKLEYIWNVLSSKVKCPRCGDKLKSKKIGHFD